MKGILIASILSAALTGEILEGTARAEQLHVTVYDKANLPAQTKQRAAQTLLFIFRHSNIEIEWETGLPEAEEATLFRYTNIVSQDQQHRAACQARRDIAVAIQPTAPPTVAWSVLGVALPFAASGINVQVYSDHIAGAALSRGVAEADLLAHALAHEIGHVLLRSLEHNGAGLMAGTWKVHEYAWIATGSMFFTREETGRIRASIAGVGCLEATSANNGTPDGLR